jgi:hypothetical protein
MSLAERLTWPRRLNQPVSQAANGLQRGGAIIPAQKYGPPLVGMADTISAMAIATSMVKKETMIQLTDMTRPSISGAPKIWTAATHADTYLQALQCLTHRRIEW